MPESNPFVGVILPVLMFLAGAIVGALLEIVIDWKWGGQIRDRLDRWQRRRSRRGRRQSLRGTDGSLFLGNRETDVILIDGNGQEHYRVENIRCPLGDELEIPEDIREAVERIARDAAEAAKHGQSAAWNGRLAAVTRFRIGRTGDEERRTLHLECRAAQYFHYMAANLPIEKEWRTDPSFIPSRARLLGDWNDWFERMPPNLVGALPINLLVLTDDGYLLFGNRSRDVAVAPGIVCCTINENLHAYRDLHIDRSELSIEILLKRAIHEELGYSDERRSLPPPQVRLLAFAVHRGNCAHGLYGYVRLDVTAAEIEHLYQSRAVDRWELERANPFRRVPANSEAVCTFIHRNNLYDNVGATAYLTLVHQGADPTLIQRTFVGLQSP